MNHISKYFHWITLFIFPFGFYYSYELLVDFNYYLFLSVINLFSTTLILYRLGKFNIYDVYLWIILFILLVGYFVKFYILSYLILNKSIYFEYLEIYYPIESLLFENPKLLISYYSDITIYLIVICICTFFFKSRSKSSFEFKRFSNKYEKINVSQNKLETLLGLTILIWVIFLSIQINLKLGFVSGDEDTSVKLPYHLAGIIMTVINLVIPLLFLIVLFFSIVKNYATTLKKTTIIYLLYGLITGLVSTSKASIYSVIISLLILWMITNSMNKKKIFILILFIPFLSFFNLLLSTYRVIRIIDPSLSFFSITSKLLIALRSSNFEELTNGGTEGAMLKLTQRIGIIMRVNGADSYLNILDYSPQFSLTRLYNLLFIETRPVNVLYSEDVLGLPSTARLAFSPSLLGFLKFLFGSTFYASIGLLAYVFFWYIVFFFIRRLNLNVEAILISILVISLAHYTSEGTLESMPFSVFIIFLFSIFLNKVFNNFTKIN